MRQHHTDVGYSRNALLHLPAADESPPPPRWTEACAHLIFETTASHDTRPLAAWASGGVAMVVHYLWDDSVHVWSWIVDDRRASWAYALGPGMLPAFRQKILWTKDNTIVYLNNRRQRRFEIFVAAVVHRCDALAEDLEANRPFSGYGLPDLPLADPTSRARQAAAARTVAALLRASAQCSIARVVRVRRLRRRVHALASAARAFAAAAAGEGGSGAKARAADFAVLLVAAYLF